MIYWSTIKEFLKFKNLLSILCSRCLATSFYIGFLPEWNRHWSAFFSLIFSITIIYNTCGFQSPLIEISYVLSLEFLYTSFVAIYSVPLFRFLHPNTDLEKITIDAFAAQILLFAISLPAIQTSNFHIIALMKHICDYYLYCNQIIFNMLSLFLIILFPYFILRFFDILELWPTGWMLLYCKNSILRLIAGVFPAIYASLVIYVIAFLFFELTLVEVIAFYKIVFTKVYFHYIFIIFVFTKYFTEKNLYILLKKIGIIKLLDHYGLINKIHYDQLYLK